MDPIAMSLLAIAGFIVLLLLGMQIGIALQASLAFAECSRGDASAAEGEQV
ncbi:MAG: hypothetical protein LBR44_10500 [Clostridiales Family XIII bacterium]|nr:hypothetical protein [Clostridiales Family XIII bacterium]